MHIIGLTGGIATGKSTVARILQSLGVPVIDADLLAREVVAPGEPAHEEVVSSFGATILNQDGTINRPLLGSIVFADPAARSRLEAITHPAIRGKTVEALATLEKAGHSTAVYMAPLLIEKGANSLVHEIWVVYLDEESQINRLRARDGITREAALQRIAAQMPMEEKKSFGKILIDNRGTLMNTERQVKTAWAKLLKDIEAGVQEKKGDGQT